MNNTRKKILIIIAIALLGELYIYPISGGFRFSAGVLAFSLVLLLIDDFNILWLSGYTGLTILFLRVTIDYFTTTHSLVEIININLPSAIYYSLYGFLALFFTLNKNKENPYLTLLSLFSIDVICNLTEAIIRNNLSNTFFRFIIIVGLIRSLITYIIYKLIKSQENIIQRKENQKRYLQLNTLISTIQAEMFYLKKSTVDIEKVMRKSYSLYENNKDNKEISEDALNIATEVHEIKKNYYRVLDGFKSFLKNYESNDSMSFNEIAFIIESNAKRYINERSKDIKLTILIKDNISINEYYIIFTILNNLITNAIDAIEGTGIIKIVEEVNSDNIILSVMNDGEAIDKELLPFIFNPGFTTKYDNKTGKPSTGIGLSHVRNLIDELSGTMKIESTTNETEFKLIIPIDHLRR